MRVARTLGTSRHALLTHKLRTSLALSGVAIGVAAVITVTAIGEGAQREVLARIEAMGTNLIVVSAGRPQRVAGRERRARTVTTLKVGDYEALVEQLPSLIAAAPAQDRTLEVKRGDRTVSTKILGSTQDFLHVRLFELAEGRFFSEQEERAALRVVVLGSRVREALFPAEDPIGETIRVRKIPFEVIGVLGAKGSTIGGTDQDDQVLIPLRTALRRVFNCDYLNNIFISARNRRTMGRAQSEIRELLRERHHLNRLDKPDDFTVQNQTRLLSAEREAASAFRWMVTSVAGISLVLGGTGILALMLLSIRERRSEIGLRMAVGARARDILAQFLLEAFALASLGGTLGVVLGAAGAWLLGLATTWQTHVSAEAVVVSLIVATSTGLGFGVFPALKAARMDPIRALSAQ